MKKQALHEKFINDKVVKSNILRIARDGSLSEFELEQWYVKCIGEFSEWDIEYEDSVIVVTTIISASVNYSTSFTKTSAFDLLHSITAAHRTDKYDSNETAKDICALFTKEVYATHQTGMLLSKMLNKPKYRNTLIDFIYERMPDSMKVESKEKSVVDYIEMLSNN